MQISLYVTTYTNKDKLNAHKNIGALTPNMYKNKKRGLVGQFVGLNKTKDPHR